MESRRPENPPPTARFDRVILLFLFALFLLASPLREWWAGPQSPWYTPYLFWGVLIGLAYYLFRRHDDAV